MSNRKNVTSDHRRHDRLLVARFAAGDSFAAEVDEARSLVEACSECAAIAADVGVVSRAVHNLPAPRRPRDFRLSAEQAEKLHGSAFDRFMRRLAAPGLGTLRPVAGLALSFGLVLAVAGGLPSLAGGAAAPRQDDSYSLEVVDRIATGAPAPTGVPSDVQPPPINGPTTATDSGPGGKQNPGSELGAETVTDPLNNAYLTPTPAPGGPTQRELAEAAGPNIDQLMLAGGTLIALLGLALLLIAWFARRRFADPLLR